MNLTLQKISQKYRKIYRKWILFMAIIQVIQNKNSIDLFYIFCFFIKL